MESAIRAVLDGIDNAIDDKDWDRCRAFFTDLVAISFEALGGGPPREVKADDLVGHWSKGLFAGKISLHTRSNYEITIDGDRATVRSKGYAFNRLPRALGDDTWEIWTRHEHTLVHGPEGWLCSGVGVPEVLRAGGNEMVRNATEA